jgi:predicted O-methyltransferase YrrM
MRTSYTNNDINYGDIIKSIAFAQSPATIVEIGILDGFSLDIFVKSTSHHTNILAYDIFDEFNGNAANKEELRSTFKEQPNVTIDYGDFYKLHHTLPSNIDILHIDVANDGDIYEFAIENYTKLMSPTGVMVLEGGSKERDEVGWMKNYNKSPINPYLQKINSMTLGSVPSITIINNTKFHSN